MELLIAIAVVAVLVAILLPAISGSRRRAQDAGALSDLRSHAATFAAYSADYRGLFPFFMNPSGPTTLRSGDRTLEFDYYFAAYNAWNVALAEQYYGGSYSIDSFHHPAEPKQYSWWTTYYYPCVFIASHQYWNASTRTGPGQWVPTRHDQLAHPSEKILLISFYPFLEHQRRSDGRPINPYARVATQAAFTDGSASTVWGDRLRHGYTSGDGDPSWGGGYHLLDYPPGLHTTDGVRGRDKR